MTQIESRLKPQDAVCVGGTGQVSSRLLFFAIVAVILLAFAVFLFVGNMSGRSGAGDVKKAVSSSSREK